MKPLNIYIHIPFCFSKCPYCSFFSCTNCQNIYEEYFSYFFKEIGEKSIQYKGREVKTIYIGGGTPNFVPQEYIEKTIKLIKKSFPLDPDIEITIETNPQYITKDNIQMYKDIGINRISIGLQTTHDRHLEELNRRYSFEEFKQKLQILKDYDINNIGIDLIFGYPHQTFDDWKNTLKEIVSLDIKHISCYSLEVEDNTPFGKLQRENKLDLPDEKIDRDMYHLACDFLSSYGFKQYEISNFAKIGYECMHNLNFWNYDDYLGFGAGAYSRVDGYIFNNPENISEYMHGINLRKEEIKNIEFEKIMLGLRLSKGIPFKEKYFISEYMDRNDINMFLNRKGMDLYNSVIREIAQI